MKITDVITEAAIAISMKKAGKKPRSVDEDLTRRGFLRGLGAAAVAGAAGSALAGTDNLDFPNKVQKMHSDMMEKNPRYAKEHEALGIALARGFVGAAAENNKRWYQKTAELLQKYGVKVNEGVAEGLNIGPQIIYATGPKTMGANDVDLVFKDLRTGKIVAHVVGNNNSLQEFALPDGGGDGGNHPERPATYEIRMNNSKAPTYVAVGDPNQDSEHKVYKLGPKQPGAQAYYGMGITLVSKLDWWSFLEKMLGEIMAEDDAIESGLVDRKGDGDLVFVKQQGVAEDTELAEEFDLIESIVEMIAEHNGVDAETVWADLESLTEDELYVFAVTSDPLMEDWQKANKRDKTDGMSQKAVNAYRRENPGSKLKTAVTTKPGKLKKGGKASKRRKSYCSRSRGQMKMHSISCAKTPDKAICKARRRWNC